MHTSVFEFVRRVVGDYSVEGRILEVGSLNVNGSVRELFAATEYVGIDLASGPGVDTVIEGDGFTFYGSRPSEFDVVVSTEMLEHDPRPWTTFAYWAFTLRPGGILILTARGFGPDQGSVHIRCYGPHDYPADYWRFSVEAIRILCEDAGFDILEAGPDTDWTAPGVFVVARRR